MSGQVLESLHDIVSAEHLTYIGGGTDIMPLLKNEVRDDKDFLFHLARNYELTILICHTTRVIIFLLSNCHC